MIKKSNEKGFTLIELLIALGIASIVMSVVIMTYQLQVRSKNTQEMLTDMNQTVRAGLEIMTHELRMAGCDLDNTANAGILVAQANQLAFSMDIGNGVTFQANGNTNDANERVRYALTGTGHLGRTTGLNPDGTGGGISQPLIRNVDALDFVYFDVNQNLLPVPVPNNRLREIRRVQVTIVAHAGEAGGTGFVRDVTDNTAYQNQQGAVVFTALGDNFRRMLFTTTIDCLNLRN